MIKGVMNPSPEKLDSRLELRLSTDTFEILKKIHVLHKIPPQELLRGLADGVADFFKQHKFFQFPAVIQPAHFLNQESKTDAPSIITRAGSEMQDPFVTTVSDEDSEGQPTDHVQSYSRGQIPTAEFESKQRHAILNRRNQSKKSRDFNRHQQMLADKTAGKIPAKK